MPNSQNNEVIQLIEKLGWFQKPTQAGLPSDNWRYVKTQDGLTAILYVVLHHSAKEPKRIPNQPDALPRLTRLHQELSSPKAGPFMALAEVRGSKGSTEILNLRVWNVAALIALEVAHTTVAELGKAIFEHWGTARSPGTS